MENIIEPACGWRETEKEREREDRSHIGVETARLTQHGREAPLAPFSRQFFHVRFHLASRQYRAETGPHRRMSLSPHSSLPIFHFTLLKRTTKSFCLLPSFRDPRLCSAFFISFARIIIASKAHHFGLQKRSFPYLAIFLSFSVSREVRQKCDKTRIRHTSMRGREFAILLLVSSIFRISIAKSKLRLCMVSRWPWSLDRIFWVSFTELSGSSGSETQKGGERRERMKAG